MNYLDELTDIHANKPISKEHTGRIIETVTISALMIFVTTYSLIAVNRLPWMKIHRSYSATPIAASSTPAGNTALIGSAANIIVAEKAEGYGITMDFFGYMMVEDFRNRDDHRP